MGPSPPQYLAMTEVGLKQSVCLPAVDRGDECDGEMRCGRPGFCTYFLELNFTGPGIRSRK